MHPANRRDTYFMRQTSNNTVTLFGHLSVDEHLAGIPSAVEGGNSKGTQQNYVGSTTSSVRGLLPMVTQNVSWYLSITLRRQSDDMAAQGQAKPSLRLAVYFGLYVTNCWACCLFNRPEISANVGDKSPFEMHVVPYRRAWSLYSSQGT